MITTIMAGFAFGYCVADREKQTKKSKRKK